MPHVGMYWSRIKPEYPTCEEQPPLSANIEHLHGPTPPPEFLLLGVPPIPRVWFIDSSGNRIIQVQREAFLHNWRKLGKGDSYPHYQAVFGAFQKYRAAFSDFVEEQKIGAVTPIQLELTYVNHIYTDEEWSKKLGVEGILSDVCWHTERKTFLPRYEALNWNLAFRLPDDQGRLHVTLNTATIADRGRSLLVLELRARGMPKQLSASAVDNWYGVAHEWIVRGFTDLTSADAHKHWGRSV